MDTVNQISGERARASWPFCNVLNTWKLSTKYKVEYYATSSTFQYQWQNHHVTKCIFVQEWRFTHDESWTNYDSVNINRHKYIKAYKSGPLTARKRNAILKWRFAGGSSVARESMVAGIYHILKHLLNKKNIFIQLKTNRCFFLSKPLHFVHIRLCLCFFSNRTFRPPDMVSEVIFNCLIHIKETDHASCESCVPTDQILLANFALMSRKYMGS